ncbi:FecR family protein [Aquimarina pacifica]|uniref:FecR family protein n=1 Tax=Aquimarina pacifica TaxID=1296415 RepID=UPI000472DE0F|nr:FecR family protein [Aquimarina pacifica]
MKEKKIIDKWLNHEELTKDESETFKKLEAYDSYMKISNTAKKINVPSYDVNSELTGLFDTLSERKKHSGSTRVLVNLLKIAAIFVIAFVAYFSIFYTSNTTIKTLASQKISIELPDHSDVLINAQSSLSYSKKDWKNNRKINLSGEAYFKVAKGEKFDVHTSLGVVSVLGTEFNVNQRDNFFEVVCYEGLVQVSYEGVETDLPAGTKLRILNGKVLKGSVTSEQPDWSENRSTFVSMPYRFVLDEFERQYDVTIFGKNIDKTTLFTGNFVHSDIKMALQSIVIPMHLNYNIDGDRITLFKE